MKSREKAGGDNYPAHLEHCNADTHTAAPDWTMWMVSNYCVMTCQPPYLAARLTRQRICNENSVEVTIYQWHVPVTCVCSPCSGCCWGGPWPRTPGPGSCSKSPGQASHAPRPLSATPPAWPSPGTSRPRSTGTEAQDLTQGADTGAVPTLIWMWSTAAVLSA